MDKNEGVEVAIGTDRKIEGLEGPSITSEKAPKV